MKYFVLLFLGALTLWADAHIFVYHRFDDSRYPTTNTSNQALIKDFEFFKNHGYKVVALDTLVQTIKQNKEVPDNWVVLTIDDSYKSFYQNGFPIFKQYGYPFSLFVFVEGTHRGFHDFCTWDELKEISKYGSIEFHSYAHKHLTQLSNAEILKDYTKGMELIKKHLGITPKYFSYPYGEYDLRVKKITKKYGFEGIINQNVGAVGQKSDIYDLDRSALVGKTDLQRAFGYSYLDAFWSEPTTYPPNKILKLITVNTHEQNAKEAQVYISGYGWEKYPLTNGLLDIKVNKKLKFSRSRIIINVNNKISSKLLIKDSYGTQ